MTFFVRATSAVLFVLLTAAAAVADSNPTLFRLFLNDGGSVVSYGEFARVDDRVVFSLPIGVDTVDPKLFLVSLPASRIDWSRTDRYALSARYQCHAVTRAEDDFQRLSSDVARVLNEVAFATDRRRALAIAEGARLTLADWPRTHFGDRQAEVREIVLLLDEAISDLRAAAGVTQFNLSLVADSPAVPLEPLLGMPSAREQLDQLFTMAALTDRPSDKVAMLQAAVALIADAGVVIPPIEAFTLRTLAETQIREELAIDARYTALSKRVIAGATRAAARARISDVERVLNTLPREDARLGSRRPELMQAIRQSVEAQLDGARRFRLLKDQWTVRRGLYREYQRSAGVQLLQLAKLQPSLEAIRRLDGPPPPALVSLQGRLRGGADRLQRIGISVPEDLRTANDLLIGAWRFAESAVNARYKAVAAGDVTTAWEASSAAAGSLLLLNRAQMEIRTLLEPPQFR